MKMRLDSSAAQVNQERAHRQLRNGKDVARDQSAGQVVCQADRRRDDQAAEEDRGPEVKMRPAHRSRRDGGRDQPSREHRSKPLHKHQIYKLTVNAFV